MELLSLWGGLAPIVPIGLAAAAAVYFDWRTLASGLLPPAFGRFSALAEAGTGSRARRFAAATLLTLVFWLGIFQPMFSAPAPEPDLASLPWGQLFLLHAILLLTLGTWFVLGYSGTARRVGFRFARQFGLASRTIWKELALGAAAGVMAWIAVLIVLILLGALIWAVGGEDAIPTQPPALVAWIAALPIGLRLALSASAGLAEELFFRGFLQPRAGIAFSTVLFVMAHLAYGQPLMLVGVTLLSLVFALLVRWRQNIWAAVVAHAVFDALQLTVVIPKALDYLEAAKPVLD